MTEPRDWWVGLVLPDPPWAGGRRPLTSPAPRGHGMISRTDSNLLHTCHAKIDQVLVGVVPTQIGHWPDVMKFWHTVVLLFASLTLFILIACEQPDESNPLASTTGTSVMSQATPTSQIAATPTSKATPIQQTPVPAPTTFALTPTRTADAHSASPAPTSTTMPPVQTSDASVEAPTDTPSEPCGALCDGRFLGRCHVGRCTRSAGCRSRPVCW